VGLKAQALDLETRRPSSAVATKSMSIPIICKQIRPVNRSARRVLHVGEISDRDGVQVRAGGTVLAVRFPPVHMGKRNRDPWKAAPLEFRGLRFPSLAPLALAILALMLAAPALFAYAYMVKLKDGSLLSARAPYTVKGARAIITLENGTITQLPLSEIDEPGTAKYNRENFGNAIAIPTPRENVLQLPGRAVRSSAASPGSGRSVDAVLSGGPLVRDARRAQRFEGRRSGPSGH
jgi:hypothetical protein